MVIKSPTLKLGSGVGGASGYIKDNIPFYSWFTDILFRFNAGGRRLLCFHGHDQLRRITWFGLGAVTMLRS